MNTPAIAKLVTWLVAFFAVHATSAPRCAAPGACTAEESAVRTEVESIRRQAAEAEVAVAFDPAEAPLYKGVHARGRTALLFAAIAAHETGLQPRFWYGAIGQDHLATGEMQVHFGAHGVRLVGDRWIKACSPLEAEEHDGCLQATDALADHTISPRVGLHILRAGGLELYTGQGPGDDAPMWIEHVVASWRAANPVPVADAEVLAAD